MLSLPLLPEPTMENPEPVECPFCLARMQIKDRNGSAWLVCRNGCPTELEAPARKPGASESGEADTLTRAAGGSS